MGYTVVAAWLATVGLLTCCCLSGNVGLRLAMVLGGNPVLLQAMKEEPPLNSKCKDKFLIQSTFITPEKENMSLHDLVRVSSLCDLHSCADVVMLSCVCRSG